MTQTWTALVLAIVLLVLVLKYVAQVRATNYINRNKDWIEEDLGRAWLNLHVNKDPKSKRVLYSVADVNSGISALQFVRLYRRAEVRNVTFLRLFKACFKAKMVHAKRKGYINVTNATPDVAARLRAQKFLLANASSASEVFLAVRMLADAEQWVDWCKAQGITAKVIHHSKAVTGWSSKTDNAILVATYGITSTKEALQFKSRLRGNNSRTFVQRTGSLPHVEESPKVKA